MAYQDVEEIQVLIGGMQSAEPEPITPIVIRHNTKSRMNLGSMYGFYGFTFSKNSGVHGQAITYAKVDQNKTLDFYSDSNGMQWGVIPDCEHNRKMLIACAKTLPFTIISGPDGLITDYKESKNAIVVEDKNKKKVKGPKDDPFYGVKLTEKMPVEGEVHQNEGQDPIEEDDGIIE